MSYEAVLAAVAVLALCFLATWLATVAIVLRDIFESLRVGPTPWDEEDES